MMFERYVVGVFALLSTLVPHLPEFARKARPRERFDRRPWMPQCGSVAEDGSLDRMSPWIGEGLMAYQPGSVRDAAKQFLNEATPAQRLTVRTANWSPAEVGLISGDSVRITLCADIHREPGVSAVSSRCQMGTEQVEAFQETEGEVSVLITTNPIEDLDRAGSLMELALRELCDLTPGESLVFEIEFNIG